MKIKSYQVRGTGHCTAEHPPPQTQAPPSNASTNKPSLEQRGLRAEILGIGLLQAQTNHKLRLHLGARLGSSRGPGSVEIACQSSPSPSRPDQTPKQRPKKRAPISGGVLLGDPFRSSSRVQPTSTHLDLLLLSLQYADDWLTCWFGQGAALVTAARFAAPIQVLVTPVRLESHAWPRPCPHRLEDEFELRAMLACVAGLKKMEHSFFKGFYLTRSGLGLVDGKFS